MAEFVEFPDPEGIVVDFLGAELSDRNDAATVATNVPRDRPDRLVKVTRTGGARRSRAHYDAQITVQCWDTSETSAERLSALCYALLWSMDEGTYGAHVPEGIGEIGGVISFPDPDTSLPRYQFTLVIRTRPKTA